MKKVAAIILFFLCSYGLAAQNAFSIATDVSGIRSFTKGQRFFAIGQTVQAQFHITQKQTVYAQLCYYIHGKSRNPLTAVAKDSLAQPQAVTYTSTSTQRYRQVSTGLKHYFKGSYNNEEDWNLYGTAGFGLLFAAVENEYNKTIDTAQYSIPQKAIAGSGNYKRLTFDVGLGVEMMLGSSIYMYAEGRTWLQASDYPSPYLYNNHTPRILSLNAGIRVLID